jgi:hypothetical protein
VSPLVVVVLARRRIAAPFAVVGRGLHRAVAFPALLELGFRTDLGVAGGGSPGIFRAAAARLRRRFKLAAVLADRRVDVLQPELLTHRGLFRHFEERVFVEHLLDLLAQLKRRQLQQADRLLQLGRQREMLRDA